MRKRKKPGPVTARAFSVSRPPYPGSILPSDASKKQQDFVSLSELRVLRASGLGAKVQRLSGEPLKGVRT